MITGEPYPVKGLIIHAHNPMVVQANTKLVYKALKSLELSVVLDYWLTPTAELADYVLPVASWLERPDFMGDYGGEQALPASIPGEYDHKNDYEIFRELGIRLGQDWPWKSLEEVFDYMLEPLGITFNQFLQGKQSRPTIEYKNYEKKGFATTTGKAELFSTILEKLGYDPLPKYVEPPETPLSRLDLVKEYPLILITGGRFKPMFHSEWRQIDSVRRRHPYPLVQVHPETAKSLGIEDGDWVWIESPRGRIRMKCQHFNGIDRRVVHCQHGWWYPELPGEEPWLHGVWESNVNVLTDDEPDHCNPIHGGWPLRTALCKVYKMKQY
jgi:anaerobic selenocysteine-containing dehydrogenase